MSTLLPIAVVMFGLGLTLAPHDFRRVLEAPKAVAGGSVALNVSLTAINSVLAVVTLPVVVNLAAAHFLGAGVQLSPQPGETAQVFAFVLVPVALGMLVRHRAPGFADRMRRPVKVASAVLLAVFVLVALAANHRVLLGHFASVGPVALVLSTVGLSAGYWLPRFAGIARPDAIASAFEAGLHNVTIALAVAVTLLPDPGIVIPPAIYGVVMYVPALICYRLLAGVKSARSGVGSH